MVCIVNIETKKKLKEMIKDGKDIFIEDPSILNPKSFMASEIPEGQNIVVTNHPKRSWFAGIYKKDGKLFVK